MTMDLAPPGFIAPEDKRHPKGPVLVRQPADLAMLAFDGRENDHVPRRENPHDFEFRLAAAEELFQRLDPLGRSVGAQCGLPAEGSEQDMVVLVPDGEK